MERLPGGQGRQRGWRKVNGDETGIHAAEAFLRERELFCVSACARFRAANSGTGGDSNAAEVPRCHVWASGWADTRDIGALILLCRSSLYPVFGGRRNIRLPSFLGRLPGRTRIHSVQGSLEDAEYLEAEMAAFGFEPTDSIDFTTMTLDSPPPESFLGGPAGLVVRAPLPGDSEEIYRLHAAYEQEEVIPPGGFFYPHACRATVNHILSSERVLAACLDGRVVGKINTNAESFTRFQIGGVYVLPEYRGRGIALAMCAAFMRRLLAEGRGINLFVKKRNTAAAALYRRLGFAAIGGYRISYF